MFRANQKTPKQNSPKTARLNTPKMTPLILPRYLSGWANARYRPIASKHPAARKSTRLAHGKSRVTGNLTKNGT